MSVCTALVFFFLRQPGYAWVGGLGIPLIAANFSAELRFLWGGREKTRFVPYTVLSLAILLIGITLSIYIESNILYFVCCVTMMAFVFAQLEDWKIGGCIFSVILILTSVPLQSRFIMVIGVLYIFVYLTHLAYSVFKNSMLFSVTLIGIGLSIMYLGYLYQANEALVLDTFDFVTPGVVKLILNRPFSVDWTPLSKLDWYYHVQKTEFSFAGVVSQPHHWILWPAALTHALAKGTVPYVSYLCAIGIILLLLAMAASNIRRSLVVDLDSNVKVTSMSIALSQDHDEHGMVVNVTGTKPLGLKTPTHIALDVNGHAFWQLAANTFGEWKVTFARSLFLPLTLSPHLISFVGFNEKSREFSATILLGTGHKGSSRLSHTTARDTLMKLKRNGPSIHVTCTLLYSKSWFSPYSKLMEREISLEEIEL
jgi:hypothetical protein